MLLESGVRCRGGSNTKRAATHSAIRPLKIYGDLIYRTNRWAPIRNRGIFGRGDYPTMGSISDGTSNTILFAERSRPSAKNSRGEVVVIASSPSAFPPSACKTQWAVNRYVNDSLVYMGESMPGYRGMAGNPYYSAVATILSPNSAVCPVVVVGAGVGW